MPAAQDYSMLLDRGWKLVSIVRDGLGPVDVSARGLAYTFYWDNQTIVVLQGRGVFNRAEVSGTTLRFTKRWVSNLFPDPSLSVDDNNFVYGELLVGEVDFSVDDTQLMLRKANIGELHLAS